MIPQRSVPVTVIIAARNEEKNLPDCLASVTWAEQVIVVDSQSTDRSQEIVEATGAEFHQFHYQGGWPKKRNWALQTLDIRNEWVLILDADERVSHALAEAISTAIQSPTHAGYYLKWRFVFLGRWMKHSWSHGWMLRLFRHQQGGYEDLGMRGQGGWDAEVHENVVVEGATGRLTPQLDHESNEDLSFWIRKQNEFSDWNAARRLEQLQDSLPPLSALWSRDPVRRRKALKSVFVRLPAKPLLTFLFLYVYKRGFLDGREGYYFCRLRAIHEFNIGAKVFEKRLDQFPNKD